MHYVQAEAEQALLGRLPMDEDEEEEGVEAKGPVAALAPAPATAVEAYVREVVERVDVIPAAALEPVMAALFAAGARPPVSLLDLARALQEGLGPPAARALLEAHPSFLPRALRALNGRIVPPDVLAAAADKERILAATPQGWGIADPPPHATAHRLLAASGLPPQLLPPYAPALKGAARTQLCRAWRYHCQRFGWDARGSEPPEDAVPHDRAVARAERDRQRRRGQGT